MIPKQRVALRKRCYGRRASHEPSKVDGQRPLEDVRVIMPERVTIKRVRIPFAECLRFPGEGKSTQGESDPNTRPKGVVDGQQVNIPAPRLKVEGPGRLLEGDRAARSARPARARAITIPKSSEGEPRKAGPGR